MAIQKLRKETAIIVEEFEQHRASQSRLAEPPLWELTNQQIKAVEEIYLEHLLDEDEELRLSGFEGRDFDDHMDSMEGFEEVSREGYAKGSVSSFILGEAEEVLSWDGIEVRLDPQSPSWPRVFRALHAAVIKASKAIRERNSGEVIETPQVELKAFKAVPKPTLEEAKEFYITERVSGSEFARRKRINRLNANMRSVKEALGEIPALPDFTVDHAYAVRDYLLNKGTLKPSSVRRELNDIKGIFSLYKAKKLRSMINPFEGLELPKSTETDKDAREPLLLIATEN
nr:hypothetical protein [Pseudorhizobium flavum]